MIYLDNNSTSPMLPEVIAIMCEAMESYGNPSAASSVGRIAKSKLAKSRRAIADYFNVMPEEVYFTSGATEANNIMVAGFQCIRPGMPISTNIEHISLLGRINDKQLTKLKIDRSGAPKAKDFETKINANTSFAFFSWANHETGVIAPIEEIGDIAYSYGVPLLIDGTVMFGREKIILHKGISALSLSLHKCHGPHGVGVLIVRKKYPIPPLFYGGGQERGLRPGTENLPAILGFVKALELISYCHMLEVRTHMENKFGGEINGALPRVRNTANIYFKGIKNIVLLAYLDANNIVAAIGPACSAANFAPSKVLMTMYSQERALASMRFSINRFTTIAEIDAAAEVINNYLLLKSRT